MQKVYFFLVLLCFAFSANAQVTGTKNIPADYATIAAAVTALNTQGVGAGGATINIPAGYTETAPSGGIVLGSATLNGSLSATNTLTFIKSGTGANPVLTAFTGGTSTTSDGIFKIAGSDYVTINGLDLKENAANTGAAQMEWGYAFVNLNGTAPFDGVQNATIRNCTVTLDKSNPNASMAFYSGHNIATAATALTITAAGDAHSNNKYYSNTVTNAGFGFFLLGFNAATPYALYDQNNDVGGTSAATGNTLSNIGGPAGFNVFGIYLSYQNGANASYNTVSGVTAVSGTAITVGIYLFGTNSNSTTNNNTITVSQSAATGNVAGIYSANTGNVTATNNNITFADPVGSSAYHYGVYSASATAVNISNNTFKQTSTGNGSGYHYYVYQSANAATSCTINDNKFDNLSVKTSGYVYFIYCSNATATYTVNNNQTVGNFVNTVGGGNFYGFYNFGSPTGGTATLTNNNFSNITLTGAGTVYGIYQATATSQVEILTNNTISNITSGSGTTYGLYHSYGAAGSLVNGNNVSGITGTGSIYGIQVGATAPGGIGVYSNNVSALSTSGGANTVYGINYAGGTNGLIYKNKISGLTSNNAGGTVYGLLISGGATSVTAYNNVIGDLKTPATTSAADAIRGISLTTTAGTTALNIYNNTVNINATSTGANFSTSALYATTSATATSGALTLRNNILINTSTPNGTGIASAYRRSSATLTNYAAGDNNLFYAGSGCTNNAMFYNGTTVYNTLTTVQTALAPRDAASKTEFSTPFLATTGIGATFLHISTTIPTVVNNGGAPVAAVTDDIDGDVRSATTPDIGADEFAGVNPAACSGTPVAGTITGNVNVCQGLSNTLTLNGYSTTSGIGIQWQSATVSGGPYTNISCANGPTLNTGVIAPGTTVYYVAVITCANGGATATTPQFAVTSFANPTVTVNPATTAICSNGTGAALTASGAATYAWSPATGLSATTGATVTANPAATTTYTVQGATAQGCIGTGTSTVTVNAAPPAPVVTPTSASVCPGGIQQLTGTSAGPVTLFSENFNVTAVGAIPAGWTKVEPTTTTIWGAINSASAGGAANEMKLECINSTTAETGTYTLNLPVQNTTGITGVNFTFNDSLSLFSTSATYAMTVNVETSFDNVTWTNQWSISNAGGSIGHHLANVTLAGCDNKPAVYIRFSLIGKPFAAFRWFIDDVKVNGNAAAPVIWSPATNLYTNSAATIPYVANTPINTVYAQPAVTTVYTASVTNASNCTSSTSVTVAVSSLPTVATAPVATAVCAGSTATFTVTAGGTGPFTYQWQVNSGAGFTNITGATAATLTLTNTTVAMNNNQYQVVISTVCGNVTSTPVTLTVNTPNAATIAYNATPYCIGSGTGTVTLTGTTGGTFTAAPAGLTINAATGAITLSSSTAGTYTVTYSMAPNGTCPAATATTTVVINTPSTAPTGVTASNPAICGALGSTNLTVVGGSLGTGATWRWYTGSCGGTPIGTGATLTNISLTATTTYYVRAEGLCNNTACASVTVTVGPVPAVVLTAGPSASLTPATPGILLATVSPVSSNYSYTFTHDGVTLINSANNNFVPLSADSSGTYTVKVTNVVTGCNATANLTIRGFANSNLFITPSPNKGQFSVRYYADASEFGKERMLSIFDEKGARVYSKRVIITAAYTAMDVNLTQVTKGIYHVMVADAGGSKLASGKVMITP